jgi:hypothetical protein
MSKFLILLLTSIEIMMITRSLRTLYYRMLKIDVLLMKDRVIVCTVKSNERININKRVVFDFLACECFAYEFFNFVFKKSSYHVLKIHDLWIDSKRCFNFDDWSRDRDCDFNLLTKEKWFHVEADTNATTICF